MRHPGITRTDPPRRWWFQPKPTLVDILRNHITRTDDVQPPAVRVADRCYPIIHSSLN